jgi:hypothetical protein
MNAQEFMETKALMHQSHSLAAPAEVLSGGFERPTIVQGGA